MASHVLDGGEVLTFRILNITTPTVTSTPSKSTATVLPSLYPGLSKYQLLGCYNLLTPIASGALPGPYGPYIINPIFDSPNELTVPLCIEACNTARTPEGVLGYTYSAVEDGSKCYCGLTISNFTLSNASLNSLCSLPCPGDQSTSCGGDGYLALYKFNATLNDFISNEPCGNIQSKSTTPSTSSADLSASPTSSENATLQTHPSHSDTANERIWLAVGISLGVSLLGILLLFIIYFCASRRHPRKRNMSIRSTEAGISSTTKSNGISGEEHFATELKRGGTIKGTVVRGKFAPESQEVLGEDEEEKEEISHDNRVLEEALEAWKSGVINAEEELLTMGRRNRTPTIVHPSEGIIESGIHSKSTTPPEAEDKRDDSGGEKVQKRRSMLDWEESQRSLWSETFFEREDGSFGRVI